MLNLQVGIGDPYSNLYRVVDLALNQSRQTLVSPIFTSVPSVAMLRKCIGDNSVTLLYLLNGVKPGSLNRWDR